EVSEKSKKPEGLRSFRPGCSQQANYPLFYLDRTRETESRDAKHQRGSDGQEAESGERVRNIGCGVPLVEEGNIPRTANWSSSITQHSECKTERTVWGNVAIRLWTIRSNRQAQSGR